MCLNELQDSYNRIIVINTIFRVVQISLPQGCSATEKTACHPEFFSHRATDLNIYAKEIIFSYDFFFLAKDQESLKFATYMYLSNSIIMCIGYFWK